MGSNPCRSAGRIQNPPSFLQPGGGAESSAHARLHQRTDRSAKCRPSAIGVCVDDGRVLQRLLRAELATASGSRTTRHRRSPRSPQGRRQAVPKAEGRKLVSQPSREKRSRGQPSAAPVVLRRILGDQAEQRGQLPLEPQHPTSSTASDSAKRQHSAGSWMSRTSGRTGSARQPGARRPRPVYRRNSRSEHREGRLCGQRLGQLRDDRPQRLRAVHGRREVVPAARRKARCGPEQVGDRGRQRHRQAMLRQCGQA